MDREKLVNELNDCLENQHISFMDGVGDIYAVSEETIRNVLSMLKEQEAEIRQLRLALDIAKGTCKGIKSGGGQFADMPTMQSAT